MSAISDFPSQAIPMIPNDVMSAFQIMDPPVCDLFGSLIHSRIDLGEMHFWEITSVQRLVVEINLQPILAASDLEKRKIFFKPQPSRAFGVAM